VYFSWRQEKYQKNHAVGVTSLAQTDFSARAGTLFAQTACPLFPKNPPALGCAAMGEANLLRPVTTPLLDQQSEFNQSAGQTSIFQGLLQTIIPCFLLTSTLSQLYG
jgi:hypothetical protein